MSNKNNIEYVNFRNRSFRVCSNPNCRNTTILDYDRCWLHLNNHEQKELKHNLKLHLKANKSLRNFVLSKADLEGIDFSNTDLSKSFLQGCNLRNCKFIDSNLESAFLAASDLTNSDLTRASISDTVFSRAKLFNTKLLAFSFNKSIKNPPINLTMDSFRSDNSLVCSKINEEIPFFSEGTYRALKVYFSNNGRYDDASWSAYKERVMQRKVLWSQKRYLNWFMTLLFGIISGYGEKPLNSIAISIFVIFIYSLIYTFLNLTVDNNIITNPTYLDNLSFSLATFCGYTFPDLTAKANLISRLIIASETFMGIFVFGIFIFTLTKKYVAR